MTSYVMCNKKKLGIRKSDIGILKKSVEDRKLEYFKSELLKILDKKEKEESGEEVSKSFIVQELYKSMTDPLYMAKGGKVGVVGEVRTWNGKKYKKMPNKKWVSIYDTHDKHTEISIARLKGRVRKAQSVDELFEIVMNNTHRFSDENGKPLDIVLELKKEVDARKYQLKGDKIKSESEPLYGFKYGKFEKSDYRKIAEKAKNATPDKDCKIDFSDLENTTTDYLKSMLESWNTSPVNSPLFDKIRIRFDGDSIKHFFYNGRKKRDVEELERRAKCLPFVRDILENTGVKGSVYQDVVTKKIAFVVMGKADIDGKETAIRLIIKKKKKGKYFYLSVHNLGEIKKSVNLPKGSSGGYPPNTDAPKNNIAQDYNNVNEKEKFYNRQQDEGQSSTKQKEQKYAKDVCKNISELKNYAKDKYNLDIVVRHGEVPFEQCLKSFVEIEKMTEDFPDLPKFIQRIQYSKPGAKWAGLYNSSSTGEYSLCIGNIEQIKKDIGDTKRPFTRGRSIEAVTRHEAGHAISEMLFKAYGEKFGIKPFDKAFEYWFYNSKENKAQNYREKYGTFENFKKEGDKTEIVSVRRKYEIAESHVRIKYHEESCNKVNKLIIDEALKSLGIGDKRRAKRSQYPTENELEKYPSLSEMWDISRYAMTSDAECIAEGVSDYLTNGEKAQKLSKAIYKVLLSKIDNGIKKSCLVRVEEIKKHFLQIWG